MQCLHCGTSLDKENKKFCNLKCKNAHNNKRYQTYDKQQERGRKRRKQLIDAKGGKCECCGYDKNYAALCFHHLDPSEKEFQLDLRKCSNSTLASLIKEAEKCQLLCHNCHMEVHYPDHTKHLEDPT